MKDIQYTIRKIPKPVDLALRKAAKQRGVSFNQAAVDALRQATGTTKKPLIHHDLDWFIGKDNINQKEFDKAMAWLDSLPNDMDL